MSSSSSISSGNFLGIYKTYLLLKNRLVSRPCNCRSKLLGSRPKVRVRVLVMLVQCIAVEVVIQLHLAPMICCLLISQMTHVSVDLELHPL